MHLRTYWRLQMGGSLVGWAFVLGGFFRPYPQATLRKIWKGACVIWFCHPLEVPLFSLKIGRAKGLSLVSIIVKTTLYGFTWWLPLKRGILSR